MDAESAVTPEPPSEPPRQQRPKGRRHTRRAVTVALALVAGILAIALLGLPLYVFPPQSAPGPSELIYVIGPPTPARIAEAEALRREGIADRVLVSVPASGDQSADDLPYCTKSFVTCQTPEPFTTRGEAAMLADYATAGDRVVVLTYTPHVARTRYIFASCADAATQVIAVDESLSLGRWIYNYAYQSAAFVKAWIVGCAPRR